MGDRRPHWSDAVLVLARSVHDLLGFEASCRFRPTCSQYARDAVAKFGPWKGGWMAVRRVARCRPGASWGWDPVDGATRSKAG